MTQILLTQILLTHILLTQILDVDFKPKLFDPYWMPINSFSTQFFYLKKFNLIEFFATLDFKLKKNQPKNMWALFLIKKLLIFVEFRFFKQKFFQP